MMQHFLIRVRRATVVITQPFAHHALVGHRQNRLHLGVFVQNAHLLRRRLEKKFPLKTKVSAGRYIRASTAAAA